MNTHYGAYGTYGVRPVLVSEEEAREADVRLQRRFGEPVDRIALQYEVDIAVCAAENQTGSGVAYASCMSAAANRRDQTYADQRVYQLATPFRMQAERQAKRARQEAAARREAKAAAEAAELEAAEPAVSPYLLIGGAVVVVGGLMWWLTRKAA